MSDNKNRKITPSSGGFINDLTSRFKLITRLMADSRVSPLLKLLPIGTLIYLVVPDLIPTPVDDAALIWLGTYLFVELCPPDVVQEHLAAINQVVPGQWQDPMRGNPGDEKGDVIDAEFNEEP